MQSWANFLLLTFKPKSPSLISCRKFIIEFSFPVSSSIGTIFSSGTFGISTRIEILLNILNQIIPKVGDVQIEVRQNAQSWTNEHGVGFDDTVKLRPLQWWRRRIPIDSKIGPHFAHAIGDNSIIAFVFTGASEHSFRCSRWQWFQKNVTQLVSVRSSFFKRIVRREYIFYCNGRTCTSILVDRRQL